MTDQSSEKQAQQAAPSDDRRGKMIFLVVMIVAAAFIYLRIQRKGGELPDWPANLNIAFAQAKAEDRPVLLLLTALPPSLDARNLGAGSIRKGTQAIKEGRFITRLVQSKKSDPAKKYEVKDFPTLIIFAPDGRELDRRSGFVGEMDFKDFLKVAAKPVKR